MAFKLVIECSKDIDKLSIDFSDGTSVVRESKPQLSGKKDPVFNEEISPQPKRSEELLDTDAEFGNVSQEIIKPPEIVREERPVKVAEELQNFDF